MKHSNKDLNMLFHIEFYHYLKKFKLLKWFLCNIINNDLIFMNNI